MQKILAVSGGVDSMVMLHLFRRDQSVIVAHFDHGIRPNSHDDATFVETIATRYGLPYFTKRQQLGAHCSEAVARAERYQFLQQLAHTYDGKIYTAHHLDDFIETIIINLWRGTQWRGLAPFMDSTCERPLLTWSKADIYRYATQHALVFRQDQSNTEASYLRNQLRDLLDARTFQPSTPLSAATPRQLLAPDLQRLGFRQRELYREIYQLGNKLIKTISKPNSYPRAPFQALPDQLALELLRQLLEQQQHYLTYPQLQRALHAIRNYHASKRFNLPADNFILFSRHHFSLEDKA